MSKKNDPYKMSNGLAGVFETVAAAVYMFCGDKGQDGVMTAKYIQNYAGSKFGSKK